MSGPKKLPVGLLLKAAVALVVLLVAVVVVLQWCGVDVAGAAKQGLAHAREIAEAAFARIRAAGPLVYFAAMAVLPAIGCPMLVFYLSAGATFAPQLGMPLVIAASLTALTINVALTYWLARHGLRPVIEWVLRRTPYRIPQVKPENELAMAVLLRVTPGPPFFLQGFILALAGVRFWPYMLASCGVQFVLGTGCIVSGEAFISGKGGPAMVGLGIIVLAVLLIQFLRRRFAKRNGETPPSA